MRLKWFLATLSAFIMLPVLLLVAVLVFLDAADLSKHRDFVAGQVSGLVGRRLSLDGELDLNLGRTTSVVITDIALANAGWASEPEMLSVERVEAEIELLPLLRGEIHIPRFHVHGAVSRVETSREGASNWVMSDARVDDDVPAADSSPSDLKLPWFGDVQLTEIDVVYLDERTGQDLSAVFDHIRLGADTPYAPTDFEVAGRVNDELVNINGKIAIPARLAADRMEFPLELHARVLGIEADASGSLSGDIESPAVNLDVEVNAADLNQLRQVFGDPVPLVDNVSIAMEVEGTQGQPVTMQLNGAAGDAKLHAQITLHREGPRPRLVASVDVDRLDVVRMWAPYFSGKPVEQEAAQPDAVQPAKPFKLDQPITFDWLEGFDADIVIVAEDLNLPQLRTQKLNSRIILDDRRLAVEDTKLDTDAGSVVAQFSLDDRGMEPAVELALEMTDVVPDRIEALADNHRLKGSSASAAVSVAARGDSVVGLVDNLSGKLELKYRNEKPGDELALKLTREPVNKSVGAPLVVSASGVVDGYAVELDGKVIYPEKVLVSEKPYELDLVAQALGVTGKLKGTVPHTLDAADFDIDARADSLEELTQVFGQGVPVIGKTALQSRLSVQQSGLRLSELSASLEKARIEGWVSLDTSGSKPDLKAELSFADLDLDKLMPATDEGPDAKPAEAKAQHRLLPDAPLPFESLSRANVQTSLRATNLLYNNRRLKHAEVNINLSDGRVDISLLKLSSVKGELLGDLTVDAGRSKTPTVMLKLKAAHIELGELLATSEGTAPVEGPLATDIILQGQGNSIAEIVGSLNGHAKLLVEKGSADAKALDLFVGGLSAMFGTIFIDQSPKTTIHCAICDLKFSDGLMTSELAVLDTQYSTVFLEGQVNLRSEQLDLKVSPEAKGVTLSVAFPVLVKGSLAAPNIDVEKTGALLKTGELWATLAYPPAALLKFDGIVGDGGQNPCVSMVAEKAGIPILEDVGKVVKGTVKGAGKVVKGTAEGTEKVVKGVGGVLEDAGSGLGKIFKQSDDAESGQTDAEDEDDFDMDF